MTDPTATPPGAPESAPSVPAEPVRTTTAWAWMLAVVPLAIGVVSVVLSVAGLASEDWGIADILVLLVFLIVELVLSYKDREVLESRGLRGASIWWNLIAAPAYLLARAIAAGPRADRQRWIVFAVSVGLVVVMLGLSIVAYAVGSVYDEGDMEATIASEIEDRAGLPSVTVDCPSSPPLTEGDGFNCSISSGGVLAGTATVVWTDDFGSYEWTANPVR